VGGGLCGQVILRAKAATGRGTHAGEVKGDDPDGKGHPGPPGWGVGQVADDLIPEKKNYVM
jgi:hypothetical protein